MDIKLKRVNILNVLSCFFYVSILKFFDKIGVSRCVYLYLIE